MDKYIVLLERTGASAQTLFDICVHEFALAATVEGFFAGFITLCLVALAWFCIRHGAKDSCGSSESEAAFCGAIACIGGSIVSSIIMICSISDALSPAINVVAKLLQ